MPRLRGKKISLKLGTTDYSFDANSIVLTHEDKPDATATFADAEFGGPYQWKLAVTGVQDTDASSFHSFIWGAAGTYVDFVFAPHGNATASATQPFYKGKVKIMKNLPTVGGGMNEEPTFDFEGWVEGDLTKIITGT